MNKRVLILIVFALSSSAFGNSGYIDFWKTLESDPADQEIIRTFVIRQPVLWVK